jgi:altronate dehydratase
MAERTTINPDAKRTLLQLDPHDNVCVALVEVRAGDEVAFGDQSITAKNDIPMGHKIAVRPIAAGEKIIKYGASIGSATQPIQPGEHVHVHNLKSDYIPTYTRGAQNPFSE